MSDEFNDGAYYGHSSYAIYSINGRLFKRVENNISRTDDLIPSQVALPLGSYTVRCSVAERWRSPHSLCHQG